MANKLVFVLLGLLCLVPTFAAPPKSTQVPFELPKKMTEMLRITIEEFTSLYTEIVDKGPNVFLEVLKDPKVVEVKTEAMESQMRILKNYLDKFEATPKYIKEKLLFDFAQMYILILDKFDSNKIDLTPEAKIIETSLNENGLKSIKDTIFSHFESFLKKFCPIAEGYFSELDEKEKISEKEFIEWYEKLKAEKNTEIKIEMFDYFIEYDEIYLAQQF